MNQMPQQTQNIYTQRHKIIARETLPCINGASYKVKTSEYNLQISPYTLVA